MKEFKCLNGELELWGELCKYYTFDLSVFHFLYVLIPQHSIGHKLFVMTEKVKSSLRIQAAKTVILHTVSGCTLSEKLRHAEKSWNRCAFALNEAR